MQHSFRCRNVSERGKADDQQDGAQAAQRRSSASLLLASLGRPTCCRCTACSSTLAPRAVALEPCETVVCCRPPLAFLTPVRLLAQGVRRAAMQPAKLYLERVLREVGNLGNSQSARANAVTLVRSALRLGTQVGHRRLFCFVTPVRCQEITKPDSLPLLRPLNINPHHAYHAQQFMCSWICKARMLGVQVQQFTGGLDRDVSVLLKRVQNIQATLRP